MTNNSFQYKTYIRKDIVKSSEFLTSPIPYSNNSQYIPMNYSGSMKDVVGLCGVRCIDYVLKYLGKKFTFEEVFNACSQIEEKNNNKELKDGIGEKTIMEVIKSLGKFKVSEIQVNNKEEIKEVFGDNSSVIIANVTELDNETKEFGSHWVVIVDIENINDKLNVLVADSTYRKEKSGGLLIYSWEDFSKIFRDCEKGEYNKDETEVLPPSTWYFGYAIKVTK